MYRLFTPMLLLALTAGCTGGNDGGADGELALDSISRPLGNDWSVQYDFVAQGQPSPQRFALAAASDAPLPLTGNTMERAAISMTGGQPVVQDVFWASGVPVALSLAGEDNRTEGIHFLSPARLSLSTPQLLQLPQLAMSTLAQRVLPNGLPLQAWHEAVQNSAEIVRLPLASASGDLFWQASFEYDGSPWPRRVEVTSGCAAPSACPFRPYQPGVWTRVQLVEGDGSAWGMDRLPDSWWSPAPSVPAEGPVPDMDPGGLAVSLAQAVSEASGRNAQVAAFQRDRPDWQVERAAFAGSNLSGETTWSIVLGSPGTAEGLSFVLEAPNGDVDLLLGAAQVSNVLEVRASVDVALSGRAAVARWLDAARPMHPCSDDPLGVHVVALEYQARRVVPYGNLEAGRVDGGFRVIERGASPECSREQMLAEWDLEHVHPVLFHHTTWMV